MINKLKLVLPFLFMLLWIFNLIYGLHKNNQRSHFLRDNYKIVSPVIITSFHPLLNVRDETRGEGIVYWFFNVDKKPHADLNLKELGFYKVSDYYCHNGTKLTIIPNNDFLEIRYDYPVKECY